MSLLLVSEQVGKMVAQVLFERDRCASRLSEMSNEFIVGVLLPAMESNVHHKAEAGAQAIAPCNLSRSVSHIHLYLCLLMSIAFQYG